MRKACIKNLEVTNRVTANTGQLVRGRGGRRNYRPHRAARRRRATGIASTGCGLRRGRGWLTLPPHDKGRKSRRLARRLDPLSRAVGSIRLILSYINADVYILCLLRDLPPPNESLLHM